MRQRALHERKHDKSHLHVSYAEANRLRQLLLSEDVDLLSKRDVATMLHIINDVYPVPQHESSGVWQPILIGIGILLILALSSL